MGLFADKYSSMSYKELCAIASRKGIHFEAVPFPGVDDDRQLAQARESLASKLAGRDASNLSRIALVVRYAGMAEMRLRTLWPLATTKR
jgi:hypothetical protein